MDNNSLSIIRLLTDALQNALNDVETWKSICRREKERADKAEAAQNERHDA